MVLYVFKEDQMKHMDAVGGGRIRLFFGVCLFVSVCCLLVCICLLVCVCGKP